MCEEVKTRVKRKPGSIIIRQRMRDECLYLKRDKQSLWSLKMFPARPLRAGWRLNLWCKVRLRGGGQQDVINMHSFVQGGRSAILMSPATYYISIFGCSVNVPSLAPPPFFFLRILGRHWLFHLAKEQAAHNPLSFCGKPSIALPFSSLLRSTYSVRNGQISSADLSPHPLPAATRLWQSQVAPLLKLTVLFLLVPSAGDCLTLTTALLNPSLLDPGHWYHLRKIILHLNISVKRPSSGISGNNTLS